MIIGVDIRCLMQNNRTGVGEYTYELLNAVFSVDKQNQYFLFYNSWTDVSKNIPKWEQENVHYIGTRWPNKLLNLLLWLKIIKLDNLVIKNCLKIKNFKLKIDLWFSPNLNFTNLSKQIKHILTIHDLSFEFFPECFTLKQRWWHKFLNPQKQCQRADVILTPSENSRSDALDKYQIADSKIQVLRSGLSSAFITHDTDNLTQVKQKYNLPDKYILYLGTLEPRKNIESVIEAYKIFNIQYPISNIQYSLVIAGAPGWKNKKILKLISQTPGVQYIGYVDEADKPALYKSASLFVYPSLYEGFGFPVLEAMAMGVPVITSNRSSLPEVADNAAYLVNPHNISEIANGMRLILSDERLRNILIERGKKQAEKFKWAETAKNIKQIIDRN